MCEGFGKNKKIQNNYLIVPNCFDALLYSGESRVRDRELQEGRERGKRNEGNIES